MKLIFERSASGRASDLLPACDVKFDGIPAELKRTQALNLPELSELDVSRHYSDLVRHVYGVNDGFYPLGSCTMKYNPCVNEDVANLPGFQNIHPLQPVHTVQGCLEVLHTLGDSLCELVGMDAMTFQPAAGAHGEFTGLLMIKSYLRDHGQTARNKIIVPDSAHGTNPASSVMAGFEVISIPSAPDGSVDLDALRGAVGEDTAGLMLTNPNTLGMFDKNILEITRIVHAAGGLCYYDGANTNAIMGTVRPGDMGFDVIHLNLHKTFSTPHGGGGPGAAAVGAKQLLADYLPGKNAVKTAEGYDLARSAKSIGNVRSFYGNFLVMVRALCYVLSLGGPGLREASRNAVLNANYLRVLLKPHCPTSNEGVCMHEFVLTLAELKEKTGVSAADIAKGMLDRGIHPPTMYFPLIVHEALMFEPTETESKDTLDEAAKAVIALLDEAVSNPEALHQAPSTTYIGRPDEVAAARKPVIRYTFNHD
jgi:glycine dehydrogenase subunit 2